MRRARGRRRRRRRRPRPSAPLPEWADAQAQKRGEQQQELAVWRMREHDALPLPIRLLDAEIGNARIARALHARGYTCPDAAAAAAQRLLEAMR